MDASVIGVLGTALGVLLAGPVTYHFSKILIAKTHDNSIDIMRRQEYCRAASKFRATVIYEFSGFYPINQYWNEKEFIRLYNSIPRIMSSAAEFRFFVKSKDSFDSAVENYDEYCRKIKFDEVSADTRYPDMRKNGEVGKREQFKIIIDHLISFADDTYDRQNLT